MKILIINTTDTGGAATAIMRIHEGLLKKGVNSKLLLLHKTRNIEESYSYFNLVPVARKKEINTLEWVSNKIILKLKRLFNSNRLKGEKIKKQELQEIISKVEIFTYPTTGYDITQLSLYKNADIVLLNWVSGFLDENIFFKNNTKPVVWRMSDLYACGGGYHYEKGFLFEELKEVVAGNMRIRNNALVNAPITFIPISHWVNEKAKESELTNKFDRQIIHNGIDLDVFKPIDKAIARMLFNLPADKKIIACGAEYINNERKGFDLLLQAFNELHNDNVILCTFGVGERISQPNIVHMGAINDERLLCMLYSSADIFVMSSVEEAFGQVMIEALACGIPVVSFPNGGSLDIVRNGINGFISKEFTAASLTEGIKKALNYPFDRSQIRKDVEARFNIDSKVEEYIKLFRKILPGPNSKN